MTTPTVAEIQRNGYTVGERVELARYTVPAGDRILYGQRVDGVVRVTDVPATDVDVPTSSSATSNKRAPTQTPRSRRSSMTTCVKQPTSMASPWRRLSGTDRLAAADQPKASEQSDPPASPLGPRWHPRHVTGLGRPVCGRDDRRGRRLGGRGNRASCEWSRRARLGSAPEGAGECAGGGSLYTDAAPYASTSAKMRLSCRSAPFSRILN